MPLSRVALGVAFVVAVGCAPDLPPAETAPATSTPSVVSATLPASVVGVAGCDARGCHGGLDAKPNPKREDKAWEFAATAWRKWDKHRRAFDALTKQRSADIIARLGDGWQPAATEARCLACHATPATAATTGPGASALHADGVGCEACHTTPGRATGEWLSAHWQKDGAAPCYASGSMRGLNTATTRAAACVGCHVGAPASDGVPVREVTHDLIAAGHPRLNFDLLTYLELMPPHWPTGRDTEPKPAAWQAGQVAAATAALTLAADRAASGRGPWPELADRNCYACHHGLSGGPPKPGWTSPLVSPPLASLLGWGEAEQKALATADRSQAATIWKGLCGKLTPGPVDAAKLTTAATAGGIRDWDAAAQGYYALRAAGRPAEPLKRLAEALRLPRGPAVVNSPVGYDPVVVAKLLAEAAGH